MQAVVHGESTLLILCQRSAGRTGVIDARDAPTAGSRHCAPPSAGCSVQPQSSPYRPLWSASFTTYSCERRRLEIREPGGDRGSGRRAERGERPRACEIVLVGSAAGGGQAWFLPWAALAVRRGFCQYVLAVLFGVLSVPLFNDFNSLTSFVSFAGDVG
jgi:hypothetical protein